MASVEINVAGWDAPDGSVDVTYDDVTLLITTVVYQNLAPQPVLLEFQNRSFTLPANTAQSVIDVSGFGWHMVLVTFRGNTHPTLPGSLSVQYPAG